MLGARRRSGVPDVHPRDIHTSDHRPRPQHVTHWFGQPRRTDLHPPRSALDRDPRAARAVARPRRTSPPRHLIPYNPTGRSPRGVRDARAQRLDRGSRGRAVNRELHDRVGRRGPRGTHQVLPQRRLGDGIRTVLGLRRRAESGAQRPDERGRRRSAESTLLAQYDTDLFVEAMEPGCTAVGSVPSSLH